MRRLFALLILAFAPLLWHAPAAASADIGCYPSWKLVQPALTGCDNLVVLGPGNDTRVNLVMLMIDRRGGKAPILQDSREPMEALFGWSTFRGRLFPRSDSPEDSSYADGEGSRCRSNASGTAAFENAVNASKKLKPDERSKLIAARKAFQPNCTGKSGGADAIAATASMTSAEARAFTAYLQGALAFYDGDYDAAAARFASLRGTSNLWLKETARYMIGRVEVNRAQLTAFDEYGSLAGTEKIDQKVIDAAEAGLRAYLKDYPRGAYAISARGLLRRVYWLGGRADKLADEYTALFALDPAARGINDGALADEIDNKLLNSLEQGRVRDPALLAMFDLFNMRSCGDCESTPIGILDIESQQELLASNPPLFAYLRAAHAFYVARKPEQVLLLLPESAPSPRMTYLELSSQMLRRMALTQLGRPVSTQSWLALLPGATLPYQRAAIELGLAMHHERSRSIAQLFESRSPVQDRVLREILLAKVADAPLLRGRARDRTATAHERDLALFTLLYKELSRGFYREFLADLALVPADASNGGGLWDLIESETVPLGLFTGDQGGGEFDCPAIKTTAAALAANAANVRARLCLAEYMRLNSFDGISLDTQLPADELGGTPSLFPARPFSRMEVYKTVIADPKAVAADKAYALYRAVRCYAPVGANSCAGADVPLAQRKAWFQRLKSDYPASRWATELRYYW